MKIKKYLTRIKYGFVPFFLSMFSVLMLANAFREFNSFDKQDTMFEYVLCVLSIVLSICTCIFLLAYMGKLFLHKQDKRKEVR